MRVPVREGIPCFLFEFDLVQPWKSTCGRLHQQQPKDKTSNNANTATMIVAAKGEDFRE